MYVVGGSAHCALPSDHQPKIQPVIAALLAGEFHRQLALSDNTGWQWWALPDWSFDFRFYTHFAQRISTTLDHQQRREQKQRFRPVFFIVVCRRQ